MPEIMLTEEQAQVLVRSSGAVVVRRPDGEVVGTLDPKERAVIAEARRRLDAGRRGIPGDRVQAHLAALQAEWDRIGPFDQAHAHALLKRLRAEEGYE